jgi:hypothetical protein
MLWRVSALSYIMLEHILQFLIALSCHVWRRPMVWCAVVCVVCGVALFLCRRWHSVQVSSGN